MPLYSFEFIVFLLAVFILHWTLFKNSAAAQNSLLVAASLLFYGWADWRSLPIVIFSIIFNFYTGRAIQRSKTNTGLYLLRLGIVVNIGTLVYFKYFNFFYDSFARFFRLYEPGPSLNILSVILPLGISFYTFQAMGYLIDLYNEDERTDWDLLTFTTFISYFPKLTAGPIERAGDFMQQVGKKRDFNYALAIDGARQILWGSFTKLVIANNCASFTGPIFDNYHHLPASTLLLGAFFYAFQVYGDFSGYSNIAIGISKLFGIRLMKNFATPFFSTNIRDYWKKWHISLSSWMMCYVFNPVSFTLRRYRKTGLIISIIITFLIIGLWHGANWTFIVFGLLHGLYFIPLILTGRIDRRTETNEGQLFPRLKKLIQMAGLFILVMLTLVIFGAGSISQAFYYIGHLCSPSIFSVPILPDLTGRTKAITTFLFILILMTVEWLQQKKEHEMQIDHIRPRTLRIGLYYIIALAILLCGSVVHINFIYSQF